MMAHVRSIARTRAAALLRRAARTTVEIAADPREASAEGVVERIRHRRGRVHVRLMLADGSDAAALLDRHDADWLELRRGDIVPVRTVAAAVSG
jgi:hypothetical protein